MIHLTERCFYACINVTLAKRQASCITANFFKNDITLEVWKIDWLDGSSVSRKKMFSLIFLEISIVSITNVFINFWTIYMHFCMVFNITESIEHQKNCRMINGVSDPPYIRSKLWATFSHRWVSKRNVLLRIIQDLCVIVFSILDTIKDVLLDTVPK